MKWERSIPGTKNVGDISVLARERYIPTAMSVAGLAGGGIISGVLFLYCMLLFC